jgi:hypothetical protein
MFTVGGQLGAAMLMLTNGLEISESRLPMKSIGTKPAPSQSNKHWDGRP